MRPYYNYVNYETLLFLPEFGNSAAVITVITKPHCNYDSFEPPDPALTIPVFKVQIPPP